MTQGKYREIEDYMFSCMKDSAHDKEHICRVLYVARTFLFKSMESEPMYSLSDDGAVSDGSADAEPSFFQEYRFKLEKMYDRFYTKRGNEIATERQHSAASFYEHMLKEVGQSYEAGKGLLRGMLEEG